MASVLDWKSSADPRDIVHIIVQALVEGKLVALPAETAYHVFASGLRPQAVESLMSLARKGKLRNPAIFLRSPQEALDYSPDMSLVAARVVNRGWPGPLVLELPVDSPSSLANQLPSAVRQHVLADQRFLAQRVAAHNAILQAMRLMPGPLVAAPIISSDGQAICQGSQVAQRLSNEVGIIVDDGATHYGGFATTLRIENNLCTVTADGVLDQATLDQLTQLVVLLVCTGNTCRSPMAEAILKHLLAQRFAEQMHSDHAVAYVGSAGINAFPGGPASTEAQIVMKKRGLNLHSHQSRAISERSLRLADFVLTMTHSHRNTIIEGQPHLARKIDLLSGSQDVSDPFGGAESVYEACADQLEDYLNKWLVQIEESWFPRWQTK